MRRFFGRWYLWNGICPGSFFSVYGWRKSLHFWLLSLSFNYYILLGLFYKVLPCTAVGPRALWYRRTLSRPSPSKIIHWKIIYFLYVYEFFFSLPSPARHVMDWLMGDFFRMFIFIFLGSMGPRRRSIFNGSVVLIYFRVVAIDSFGKIYK